MFKITIIAIGKIKDKNLNIISKNYLKKLSPFAKIELKELEAVSFTANNKDKAKKLDEEKILNALRNIKDSIIILLDEKGEKITSPQFANFIEKEKNNLVFILGGALGFSTEFKVNFRQTALSEMTLTHEMARVVLLEQIYRAVTIIRGKVYHY
jgi:23S rRNA (pseudouridine1915-N3)-methyltransferase